MHSNEGTLRAYLDGELSEQACNSVAAHLRQCRACRKQLEILASRVSATSEHLQVLSPRGGVGYNATLPAPAPVALARLHSRLANENARQAASGGHVTMFQQLFTRHIMARKYRAVWAGLAAIVVIGLLFTLAPVQAAASEFLGLFRVRKFAIVSINPANLQSLENAGGQIDKLLADNVTFVKKPSEPVVVTSQAEASQKAGIRVRLPSKLSALGTTPQPKLEVSDGMQARLKVDLARLQAIVDAAGRTDIKLPRALDGANIEFNVPPMVVATYDGCEPRTTSTCVQLVQAASPSVEAPAGVNLSQVGEAMLQLLGLSPAEAKHFAQAIDWSSTLVIPLPTDVASFRDVTIDGTSGVLIESRSSSRSLVKTQYMLLWQKNDIVYGLSASDDAAKAIEIANSLK